MLVTDAWFHISWHDEFLTWDPNNYQQLKQIHMNPNEIWKPDIVLINSADQDNLLNVFTDSDILVNSTGDVTWITMGLLRSKCPIWAYDYPYTVRPITCRLSFCSLIYQSHEVNLTTPGNEFFLAGPWFINPRIQMINATGERYEKYYEGYGTYSFESLTVQLRRRDNALPMLMKIPTLASITMVLCMFFLPVTWPLRIHLALFAIFIQLLLILYIGVQLGSNAIGLARPISFLRDDLFLSTMALVLTLIFRRLILLADFMPQVPYALSNLLEGPLARLLCFGINESEYKQHVESYNNATAANQKQRTISTQPRRGFSIDHVALINEDSNPNEPDSADGARTKEANTRINIGDQTSSLSMGPQSYSSASINVQTISSSQKEWMLMVIFCDRLLFAFYALIMIPRLV